MVGPGDGCEAGKGSSYAAPYVAAMLAELHLRCGVGGASLINALHAVADRRPPYNQVEAYGAGAVIMEGALRVCPS